MGKPEHPEETHPDTGRNMQTPHRKATPSAKRTGDLLAVRPSPRHPRLIGSSKDTPRSHWFPLELIRPCPATVCCSLFCAEMKSLLGVLSLVLVLVYIQADDPCPEARPATDIHKLNGDWVMTFASYEKKYSDSMPNLTSSFIEVRVQHDNHTLFMTERTTYNGGDKCANYHFLAHDDPNDSHLHFTLVGGTETKDGVTKPFTDTATLDFYPSEDHKMKLHYQGTLFGKFFLEYRRDGQHVDIPKADHDDHTHMAKCLKLHGDEHEQWDYHQDDFCHKKSALPTLGSGELSQVEGDWVLLWMVHEKDKQYHNFTSSRIHLHVKEDGHTVEFHELNHMGDKCVEFNGTMVLPEKSEKIHRLTMSGATETVDGQSKPFEDTATAEFFPSPDNIMEMYYISKNHGPFLLEYRKHGHHKQVEGCERDKHHEEHMELAKYFGLTGDHYVQWHYDGVADLCEQKASS